jgi:hypothetical protein
MIKWLRSGVATLIMSSMALGAAMQPARADTTSTLLITAAAVAALMTGINVAEKNAKANQLVGYLPNGSPVYADGHVVARNGQTWYPGNQGENIQCNGGQCFIVGANMGYGGYGGYPGYGAYPANYGGAYPANYGGAYPANYGGNYYPQNYGGGYYPGTTTVNRYVDKTYKTIIERRHRRDRDRNGDQGNHDGDGPGR